MWWNWFKSTFKELGSNWTRWLILMTWYDLMIFKIWPKQVDVKLLSMRLKDPQCHRVTFGQKLEQGKHTEIRVSSHLSCHRTTCFAVASYWRPRFNFARDELADCEIAFQDLQDIQYIGEMSPMSQFRHFDLVICLWNDKMTGLGRQILNTFAWCAKLNGSRWQNKRTWRTVVRDVSWSKTSKIWYWIFCQILRARAHWRKQFPFTLCFMKLQGSLGVSAEVFAGLVGHMVPWPPRCLNWTGYEQLRV